MSRPVALRCVIVDDNPEFLRVASLLLAGEDIDVVAVASTSVAALAAVAEHAPDVVLVDVKLGGESGFVVARELVATGSAVILISTYARCDFDALCADSPACGFVSKSELSGDAIRELVA